MHSGQTSGAKEISRFLYGHEVELGLWRLWNQAVAVTVEQWNSGTVGKRLGDDLLVRR